MEHVLNFLFSNQIVLGILLAQPFFMPWHEMRSRFALRFSLSILVALVCSLISLFLWFIPRPIYYLVPFLLSFGTAMLCFKAGVKSSVFVATSAYCVQFITSKMAYSTYYFLLMYTKTGISDIQWMILTFLFLSNILVLTCTYFTVTKRFLKNKDLKFDNAKISFFSAAFIVVAVCLSHFAESNLSWANYAWNYFYLSAICCLFAVLVLIMNLMNCKYKRLEEEKHAIEQLLKKEEIQYERAKLNLERIKIRCHDLKYLQEVISEDEKEKLENEIKELQAMYYTGNKAVDVTLSEKALLCANEGIRFLCSVDGKCLDGLTPYHVYSLLGNAIDNAVESLMKVEDKEKRILRINMGMRGDMSILQVENYTAEPVEIVDGEIVTTKKDKENHGWGLKSIKNIVKEYDGNMHVSATEDQFKLTIMFPFFVKNSKILLFFRIGILGV